jgi:hypothetical protein
MDDTFVIWSQGPDRLRDILDHLNNVHQNIQLTTVNTKIYWRPNNYVGHKVYCIPTHTNLYLNSGSHHVPKKLAIFNRLVYKAEVCVTKAVFMLSSCF